MREGWTIRIFDSIEAADAADREENLRRTGRQRIQLLTAISTPDAEGPDRDFQDLINCLTSQSVEFLIVGAHALAFHGIARFTNDLDVWVRRSEENAERLRLALNEFGVPISEQEARELLLERKFLKLGREPRRVDILNFLDGCNFEEAFARAEHETLGESSVAILGLKDYVATKRASGRPKDLSDLALLESSLGELPG